ncbi:monofunctional biosynthetic peptidoglycan transglycosylase [Aestuariibius sp. HNIBRBA575]|uniref:monofunctional biosynthetic peptidoglycan transglycosylase n=1 Tax=Aestuariibius sp. HNIBRBA575 TaxID=3233343 RepID=UPI0034A1F43D
MAKKSSKKTTEPKAKRFQPLRWLRRWTLRIGGGIVLFVLLIVALFSVVNPPTTYYIVSEGSRLGGVDRDWVPMEQIAPVMARAAVAAEDADFCEHWGLDVSAIQSAIESGGDRGGSTISQQTVKNVFLWHGRTYTRKALEAMITPVVELLWSKQRILEVYLNIAEFDEGVFGVQAASQHYFGVDAADLSSVQAARLAAILPAPKSRSASNPSSFVRNRAAGIIDGAATIRADGRADCFE